MLEALVRDEPGCADAPSRRRRSDKAEEEERMSAYPSPLLWYEEIRPSDIDAYHAANRRRPSGNVSACSSGDPLPSNGSRAAEPKRPDAGGGGAVGLVEGGLRPAASGVRRPAEEVLGQETETEAGVPGPRPPAGSTPSSTKPRGPGPHGDPSGADEERRREGGAAVARTEPASLDPPGNSDGRCPPLAMAPAATTTTPDPSQATQATQATQTAFLPGLPSQVLVTQERERDQRHGGAEWEERSEGDESSQEEEQEEDEAAASESDSPFPRNPTPSAQEDSSAGDGAAVSWRGGAAGGEGRVTEPESDSRNTAAAREGEDEYSRLNDRFTRALREFVGREEGLGRGNVRKDGPGQGLVVPGVGGTGIGVTGSSGCGRSKPPFVYVSTPEVLPRGCSGGQARAVALLEEHLSLARKRFPGGGYAVRALHLACQTLRQPTVCVKGGREAAAAAAADDDHHPEVVGVAGFVWEILRS